MELKCPRCGFTQADFKKSGRLGCPDCYKTFADGLAGLLKTMHKGTRHVGKTPEALRATRDNADRLKTLQKKLMKAIESEHFEDAAHLRDEINQITERSPDPKEPDPMKDLHTFLCSPAEPRDAMAPMTASSCPAACGSPET